MFPNETVIVEAVRLADSAITTRAIRARLAPGRRKVRLFGTSVKTGKGARLARPVSTIVLYLLPGARCPHATPECLRSCIGLTAGMMITPAVRTSQRWKTDALSRDPVAFVALLVREARTHVARARRQGYEPAIRVDGSSDTGIGQLLAFAGAVPGARWYDYTKDPRRALAVARATATARARRKRPVYSLTFSDSGRNAADVAAVLAAGGNVARVFATRGDLPADVIDGDRHDIRHRDRGTSRIIGLRLKSNIGSFDAARARAGRFAVHVT